MLCRVAVATGTCLSPGSTRKLGAPLNALQRCSRQQSRSEDAVAVRWHAFFRCLHPYFAYVYAAGYSGAHVHTTPCNGLWITLSALL